jgi:CheY-like chemotaxis protein
MTPVGLKAPLLVVEDNEADFEVISLLLGEAGVSSLIIHCRTGEEALRYLSELQKKLPAEQTLPAHVLLDLNLPGVSGLDVLMELRKGDRFALVPVTVLTTSSHPNDIDSCYRAGANSYLIKPVDFQRFQKMLSSFAEYWFQVAVSPSLTHVYA